MNTSQTGILSEILKNGTPSAATLAYFRERLRHRIHQFVLGEFRNRQKDGLTQADVARFLDRRPEQVHRWLGTPGNWTLDTVSDLLLAISKAELEFSVNPLDGRAARNFRGPEWINQVTGTSAQPIQQSTGIGTTPQLGFYGGLGTSGTTPSSIAPSGMTPSGTTSADTTLLRSAA